MTLSCITNRCTTDFSQHLAGVGILGGLAVGAFGLATANNVAAAAGGGLLITNGPLCLRIGFLRKINDLTKVVAQSNRVEEHLQETAQHTTENLETLLQKIRTLEERLHTTDKEKGVLLQSITTLQTQLQQTGKQCEGLDVQMLSLQTATEQDSEEFNALRKAQEAQTASLIDVTKALKLDTSTLQTAAQRFSGEAEKEAKENKTFRELLQQLQTQRNHLEAVLEENRSLKDAIETSTRTCNALTQCMERLKTLPPSPHEMK